MSRRTYDTLKRILMLAQDQRVNLGESREGTHEPLWIDFERMTMLASVNALRATQGKQPVTYADVVAKEQLATGHIDYTVKYALGCEDLVRGD